MAIVKPNLVKTLAKIDYINVHLIPSLSNLVHGYAIFDRADEYEQKEEKGVIVPLELLKISAEIGRVDIFRKLRSQSAILEVDHKQTLLRLASGNGHVAVLIELRTNWGLTSEDARAEDNYALRWASASGHVAVLVELRTNWGLTGEDARAKGNWALRWAAQNGHVAVLVELRRNWNVDA